MNELKVEIKWWFQQCSNLFPFFVLDNLFCPGNIIVGVDVINGNVTKIDVAVGVGVEMLWVDDFQDYINWKKGGG